MYITQSPIPQMTYTARHQGLPRPVTRHNPATRPNDIRFGADPFFEFLLAMSFPVIFFGSLITGIIVSETRWNKTRMAMNDINSNLTSNRIHRLSEPEIVEQDGQIIKRYDISSGSSKYTVTETYAKPKPGEDQGFATSPNRKLVAFKMEAISGSFKRKNKPVIKYTVDESSGQPVKTLQFTGWFGGHETRRKGIIKKVETLISVLQQHTNEVTLSHFIEGKENLPTVNTQATEEKSQANTTPAQSEDILKAPPTQQTPKSGFEVEEDTSLKSALERYADSKDKEKIRSIQIKK